TPPRRGAAPCRQFPSREGAGVGLFPTGSWEKRRNPGHPFPFDHFPKMVRYSFDDPFEERLSTLSRRHTWTGIGLVRPNLFADVSREGCQRDAGFKFLGVAGQIVWEPVAAFQEFFRVRLREHIPIGQKLQVNRIAAQELIPGRVTRGHVSASPVEHPNIFEARLPTAVDPNGMSRAA